MIIRKTENVMLDEAKRKKKRQKSGLSPFCYMGQEDKKKESEVKVDAGNVEQGIEFFNSTFGETSGESTASTSGETASSGMMESLEHSDFWRMYDSGEIEPKLYTFKAKSPNENHLVEMEIASFEYNGKYYLRIVPTYEDYSLERGRKTYRMSGKSNGYIKEFPDKNWANNYFRKITQGLIRINEIDAMTEAKEHLKPIETGKLFNELLDSLKEVAEMENCPQAINEIDHIKKYGLNESLLNEVYPNKGESKKDFISRFMSVTKDEYPDRKQRYAVALSYWDRRNKKKNESKGNIMKFKLVENMNEDINITIDFCWVIDIENHSQYTRTDDKELEYYDFDIDEATNIADNAIDNFENSITNNVIHHKEEICKELNISDFDIGEGDYDYDNYDDHLIKKIDFCIWIPKDAEVSIEKIKSVLSKYMDKTFSYSDNVSYDTGDYDEMNVSIELFISSYLTDAKFLNEDIEDKDTFDERFDKEFDKYISTPLSINEFNKIFEEMINFEREYNIIKKDKNVKSTIKLDGEVKSLDDLIKDESLKEASYGGAYDIADDQYFTRDDINEFAYELEEALDDEFHDVEYVSAYIENGEIEVTLRFRDYEETVTKKIDMRKIKSPKDLMNKYIDVFYNEFFELFEDDRELDNRSTLERGFYED